MVEKEERPLGELFAQVVPRDLVKFGLIPEFIGRVPVTVALNELDEEAMVRILTEPKNALIKQFERLFDMDGVQLIFTEDAGRWPKRPWNGISAPGACGPCWKTP